MLKRPLVCVVLLTFFLSLIAPYKISYAQTTLDLPAPGVMISLTPGYQPVIIRGLTVHKDNPFLFDFIVDVGQDRLTGQPLKNESEKLIKYFMASLAIPDHDVWVNLSPYEKNRMIPKALSQTDMGRDLLEQDYILKQLTASLIYPEKDLGKEFWDEVYARAQAIYGTTQIPVNTFNKVWIMADRAEVFERNQTVFVVDCHLKVMLEEDYLAKRKHIVKTPLLTSYDKDAINRVSTTNNINSLSSQIVREIVLPALEKEVNTGKNFANLRQIFNSIILANWYKNNLKEALLNQLYADKSKVKGIDLNDPTIKEQIYQQYLKAYKKGVFNYIKEDSINGQAVPKKYFSGGINPGMAAQPVEDGAMVGSFKLYDRVKDSIFALVTTGFIFAAFNRSFAHQQYRQRILGNNAMTALADTQINISPTNIMVSQMANASHLMTWSPDGTKLLPNDTVLIPRGNQSLVYFLDENEFENGALGNQLEFIPERTSLGQEAEGISFQSEERMEEGKQVVMGGQPVFLPESSSEKIFKLTFTKQGTFVTNVSEKGTILANAAMFSPSAVDAPIIRKYVQEPRMKLFMLNPKKMRRRIQAMLNGSDGVVGVLIAQNAIPMAKGLVDPEPRYKEYMDGFGFLEKGVMPDHVRSVAASFYLSLVQMRYSPESLINQWVTVCLGTWNGQKETIRIMVKEITDKQLKGIGEDGSNVRISQNQFLYAYTDAAMNSHELVLSNKSQVHTAFVRGGIDLNTSNGMQWQDRKVGSGVEMNINLAMMSQIKRYGIDNLKPVIFKITPLISIWPMIGLKEPDEEHLANV